MIRTHRRKGAGIAAFLLLSLLFLMAVPSLAAGEAQGEAREERVAHRVISVKRNGSPIALDARLIGDTTYVGLRSFTDAVGDYRIAWNAKTREATVTGKGLTLKTADLGYVTVANGRYLYYEKPSLILSNGSLYIPVRVAVKAFGLSLTWNGSDYSIDLTGKVAHIESGDSFYNKDDLYWLSRIISAESRGEPLLGQIAVGNVVLNRVRSPMYPNTIYGVIFDRKHGVQFSPILNGSIYKEPYSLSVIAAKICLEGTSLDNKILFFFEPRASTSSWISDNRPFAFRIQNHYFYY